MYVSAPDPWGHGWYLYKPLLPLPSPCFFMPPLRRTTWILSSLAGWSWSTLLETEDGLREKWEFWNLNKYRVSLKFYCLQQRIWVFREFSDKPATVSLKKSTCGRRGFETIPRVCAVFQVKVRQWLPFGQHWSQHSVDHLLGICCLDSTQNWQL